MTDQQHEGQAERDKPAHGDRDRLLRESAALARQVLAAADEADGKQRRAVRDGNDRWHMSREIPVSLLAVVILQTVAFVFWIATLSSTVTNIVTLMQEFRAERYTRDDARRDRELQDQKLEALRTSDREFDRRMGLAEGRVDRMERK